MAVQSIFTAKRIHDDEIVRGRLIADDVILPLNQQFKVIDDTIYGGPFEAYVVDKETVKPELSAMWHNNLEEKPECTDEYLCCCLFGDRGDFTHEMVVIKYDTYTQQWDCDYNIIITHWMELPEWPLVIPAPTKEEIHCYCCGAESNERYEEYKNKCIDECNEKDDPKEVNQ